MLILVDEALPHAVQRFSTVGEVRIFSGRPLTSEAIGGADALIVRSVTRVDGALVGASSVRFVGTVTAGTDHLDLPWLASRGIHVAASPGFNARPVAEYVLTAILLLAERHGFEPTGKTLGVVGVGHVGSIVADWAGELGIRVLRNDPPLQGKGSSNREDWVEIEQVLDESDIVSLHVPLNREGPYSTKEIVNQRWLSAMRPGAFLINTSRGEVVLESELMHSLVSGKLAGVVLDVWRDEPHINRELALRADIATPHVAGYSREAKQRGVDMVFSAFCRVMGITPPPHTSEAHATGGRIHIYKSLEQDKKTLARLLGITTSACDLPAMHTALSRAMAGPRASEDFETVRAAFAARREFTAHHVDEAVTDPAIASLLTKWGFHVGTE